jgi:hypothetical protein
LWQWLKRKFLGTVLEAFRAAHWRTDAAAPGPPGNVGRPLKRDAVIRPLIVIPPFTDARCSEPSNKGEVVGGKVPLKEIEVDDEAETIPLEILRVTITIGRPDNRVRHSPRCKEGRRNMRKGGDVFA